MITWKMLVFTLLIIFSAVFDIFNIIFHFCCLKSKFWERFPSKISFWLSHTSYENGPTIIQTAAMDYWIEVTLTSILILKAIHSVHKSKRYSSQSSLQAFRGYFLLLIFFKKRPVYSMNQEIHCITNGGLLALLLNKYYIYIYIYYVHNPFNTVIKI